MAAGHPRTEPREHGSSSAHPPVAGRSDTGRTPDRFAAPAAAGRRRGCHCRSAGLGRADRRARVPGRGGAGRKRTLSRPVGARAAAGRRACGARAGGGDRLGCGPRRPRATAARGREATAHQPRPGERSGSRGACREHRRHVALDRLLVARTRSVRGRAWPAGSAARCPVRPDVDRRRARGPSRGRHRPRRRPGRPPGARTRSRCRRRARHRERASESGSPRARRGAASLARPHRRGGRSDARRQLERDLHDGAQQHLVALSLELQMAPSPARGRAGGASSSWTASIEKLSSALAELRELARGIHPAILTHRGLGAALTRCSSARRSRWRGERPAERASHPPRRRPPLRRRSRDSRTC